MRIYSVRKLTIVAIINIATNLSLFCRDNSIATKWQRHTFFEAIAEINLNGLALFPGFLAERKRIIFLYTNSEVVVIMLLCYFR